MTSRFPTAPVVLRDALNAMAVLRGGDKEAIADLGDTSNLPRPWLVQSWPNEFRADIWQWCDAVADWLNREYAWRPAQMIPACWPQHPHIAHELPVLAVLRLQAEQAATIDPLEDWHRYALPTFMDRMIGRLGESTCRSGTHIDWPAASRYDTYTASAAFDERQAQIRADTAATPTPPLRLARDAMR